MKALLRIQLFLITTSIFFSTPLSASPDSLRFDNGNVISGEVKSLLKGVLEIDADYNDSNIKVTWLEVSEIFTTSEFEITSNGSIYFGRLQSTGKDSVRIVKGDSLVLTCLKKDIVFMSQVKDRFSDRFNALIEVGLNIARAQTYRQFSTRSAIGYRAPRWATQASYNSLLTEQAETDPIRRNEGEANIRFLPWDKWYIMTSISMLSNTQQRIDLRVNSQIAMGRYLLSSNKAYWGVRIGANSNLERFEGEGQSNNSWEGLLGTEINIYDVSDFDLLLNFNGYSGLSDLSRYRADASLDVKYDLPFDFFVRLGTSINYDNKPAENATPLDYVIRTGLGWEW